MAGATLYQTWHSRKAVSRDPPDRAFVNAWPLWVTDVTSPSVSEVSLFATKTTSTVFDPEIFGLEKVVELTPATTPELVLAPNTTAIYRY